MSKIISTTVQTIKVLEIRLKVYRADRRTWSDTLYHFCDSCDTVGCEPKYRFDDIPSLRERIEGMMDPCVASLRKLVDDNIVNETGLIITLIAND